MPRKKLIKVDETDPVGEIEPSFPWRDVVIKRNVDIKQFYDLQSEIGRGKFGTVYRCKEKATGLTLAAKFVGIAKRNDRRNVEREVEIMRELQHPRLIQIYDAFESSNVMCVVLELIEGGELFERVIDDDFVLTEKAVAIFMRQICEGVDFIHSKNVLHLDMKPENILCLTKTGNRIKIIDFGLARKFDPEKKLQVLFGTPEFVAPEVVNFDAISFGTDMWSVGVICYVLLSGLSPFMGETDVQTMANVTIAQYDFDDECFNEISDDAKDFIRKLLLKDREARMTAAQSLQHPWLSRHPTPDPNLANSKENIKECVERWSPEKQLPALNTKKNLKQSSPPISEKKLKLDIPIADSTKENAPPNTEKRQKHELQDTPDDTTQEKKMKIETPTQPNEILSLPSNSFEKVNLIDETEIATPVIEKKTKLHPPPTPDIEFGKSTENSTEKKMKVHTPFTPDQTRVSPFDKENLKPNEFSEPKSVKEENITTPLNKLMNTAASKKSSTPAINLKAEGNASNETKRTINSIDKQESPREVYKSKLEFSDANTSVKSRENLPGTTTDSHERVPTKGSEVIKSDAENSLHLSTNISSSVGGKKISDPTSPKVYKTVEQLPKPTTPVSQTVSNVLISPVTKPKPDIVPTTITKIASDSDKNLNELNSSLTTTTTENLPQTNIKVSSTLNNEKINKSFVVAKPGTETLPQEMTNASPTESKEKPITPVITPTIENLLTSAVKEINKNKSNALESSVTTLKIDSSPKATVYDDNNRETSVLSTQTKPKNLVSKAPTTSNEKPKETASPTTKSQIEIPKVPITVSSSTSNEKPKDPPSPSPKPQVENLPKVPTKVSPSTSNEKIKDPKSQTDKLKVENLQKGPIKVSSSTSNEKLKEPSSPTTKPKIKETKIATPPSITDKVNVAQGDSDIKKETLIKNPQVTGLTVKTSVENSKENVRTPLSETKENLPVANVMKTYPKDSKLASNEKETSVISRERKSPLGNVAAVDIETSIKPNIPNPVNTTVVDDIARLKIDDNKKKLQMSPNVHHESETNTHLPSQSKESTQVAQSKASSTTEKRLSPSSCPDGSTLSSPSKQSNSNPLNIPIISSDRTFQRGAAKSISPVSSRSQTTAQIINAQNDEIIQKISELTANNNSTTINEVLPTIRTIKVRRDVINGSQEDSNEKPSVKDSGENKMSTVVKETKSASSTSKVKTQTEEEKIESNEKVVSMNKTDTSETPRSSNLKIPKIITHKIHIETDDAENSNTSSAVRSGSKETKLKVHDDFRQDRRASDISCFFPGEDDFITEEINRLSDRLKDLKSSSFDNGSSGESLLNRMRRPKYKISHCSRDVPVNSPPPASNMTYYMRTSQSPRSQSPKDDVLIKFLTQFNDKSDAKAKLDVHKKETAAV